MKRLLCTNCSVFKLLLLACGLIAAVSCKKTDEPQEPAAKVNPTEINASIPAFTSKSGDSIQIEWLEDDSFVVEGAESQVVMSRKEGDNFENLTQELIAGETYTANYQHYSSENFDPHNYSYTQVGNDLSHLNSLVEMTKEFTYGANTSFVFEHTTALMHLKIHLPVAPKSLVYDDGVTTVNVDFKDVAAGDFDLYFPVEPMDAVGGLSLDIVDVEDGEYGVLYDLETSFDRGTISVIEYKIMEECELVEVSVEPSDDSAVISMSPLDELHPYMMFNMTQEEFELSGGESDPDYFVNTLMTRFINYGGSPLYVDDINVFQGDVDLNLTGLVPETQYVVIAMLADVRSDESYEILQLPTFVHYTTLPYIEPELELESVEITDVTSQDGTVTIKTGEYSGNYFSRLCDKKDFEAFYQNDPLKAALSMVQNAAAKGVDFSTPDGNYIWSGDASYQLADVYPGLLPEIDYFIFTFGVDENGVILTKVVSTQFTTTAPSSDISKIDISVTHITASSAYVQFAPDVNGLPYYATVFEKSYLEGLSDEEIVAKLSSEENFTGSVREYPVANTITGLEENMEYQAIAFGYDEENQVATTEVFEVVFTASSDVVLPTSIILSKAEFGDVYIDNLQADSFDFNCEPLDKTMHYIVIGSFGSHGVFTADQIEGKSDEELILEDLDFVAKQAGAAGLSFSEALANPMVTKVDDWSNVYGPTVQGETYYIFVYGIDITTAQPITKLVKVEYTVE